MLINMTILDNIIRDKKKEVALAKKRVALNFLKQQILKSKKNIRQFKKTGNLQLIAEIKAKSPSAGVVRAKINAVNLARQFQAGGASAISVLTDKKYFGGSLKNLSAAQKAANLPILRKEFIIDPYQVYESRVFGADIILLIAAVLKNRIKDFVSLALKLNLQPLIEVHGKKEMLMVLKLVKPSPHIIIGINNRDLKTFKIELNTSLSLAKMIPDKFIKISESGVFEISQLQKLSAAGFDGVLIGGGLVKNPKLFEYFK